MKALDRILTIIVTATLTSIVWIIVGSGSVSKDAVLGNREVPRIASQQSSSAPPDGQTLAPQQSAAGRATAGLLVPVRGVKPGDLVDTFTQARAAGARRHDAIDIMAPTGTAVVSASAGVVEKLFISDLGGKTVYVRSPDRLLVHYYAHLDAYARGLREGQRVQQGQFLGTVGSTGNADPAAPHLHYQILQTRPDAAWFDDARAINPYPLLTRTAN